MDSSTSKWKLIPTQYVNECATFVINILHSFKFSVGDVTRPTFLIQDRYLYFQNERSLPDINVGFFCVFFFNLLIIMILIPSILALSGTLAIG